MTDFQPGDVDENGAETDSTRPCTADAPCVCHSFATSTDQLEFHGYRVCACSGAPVTLSPQAVLDAILDHQYATNEWHRFAIENADERLVWVTARKVDGHWQVKSVGGGE